MELFSGPSEPEEKRRELACPDHATAMSRIPDTSEISVRADFVFGKFKPNEVGSRSRDGALRLAARLAQAQPPAELALDLLAEALAAERHTVTDRVANLCEHLVVERPARSFLVDPRARLRRVAETQVPVVIDQESRAVREEMSPCARPAILLRRRDDARPDRVGLDIAIQR